MSSSFAPFFKIATAQAHYLIRNQFIRRSVAPIPARLARLPVPTILQPVPAIAERFVEARIRLWPERCSHGLVT
jgi:hypothetical protein